MTNQATRKLISAILARQLETGRYGEIRQDRLREALTTGPALSEAERSILLLSPVAREDWNQASKEIADELRERWAALDIELKLVPLAAATESDAPVIALNGDGFSVVLYRQDGEGHSWVILVQLGTQIRNTIDPMTRLRLVDDGGLEWMEGQPDSSGEMTALWQDVKENLADRARRYCLILEPT